MISSGIDNTPVYTDSHSLDRLKMLSRNDPDKALDSVARQFESLFTQTLLKTMRDTSLSDGLFDNDQSRLYQDLFDKQISTNLSQRKGVGLADVLIRQLSPKGGDSSSSSKVDVSKIILPMQRVSAGVSSLSNPPEFKSPEDYLRKMYPAAVEVEKKHGIPAAVILAQSALETGWGRHIMPSNKGGSSYNLFGIKADSRWQGEVATANTIEYRHGIAEKRNENFRSYNNFKDSMEDYAQFIKSSPRYSQAILNADQPQRYTRELQRAGYATDPNYSMKINNIMISSGFNSVLNEFKNGIDRPLT